MMKCALYSLTAILLVLAVSCNGQPEGSPAGVTNYTMLTNSVQTTNVVTAYTTNIVTNSLTNYSTNVVTNAVTNFGTNILTNMVTNAVTNTNTLTNSLSNSVTNWAYLTNVTGVTNLVHMTLTDTVQGAVSTNMMTLVAGDWLLSNETTLATMETVDQNGFTVYYLANVTNTVSGITNDGPTGATVWSFKPEGTVDRASYQTNGDLISTEVNWRLFGVYTNAAGSYIELTDPASVTETVWWEPQGPTADGDVTYYLKRTNFSANYALTNVDELTNFSYRVITNTNSWRIHSQKSRLIYSFTCTLSNSNTEFYLRPNGVSNVMPSRARSRERSYGQWTENRTSVPGDEESVSSTVTFSPQTWNTYDLVKLP